jgi:TPR repeat protein
MPNNYRPTKMSFETIKEWINDFVYKNSYNAYCNLDAMLSANIVVSTIKCQVCGYLDSLKNINGNSAILFGELYYYGFYVMKDYKKASAMYRKAIIIDDNTISHFHIGYMYMHGYGINRNFDMALYHYDIAAKGGHAPAQYNLGSAYTTLDIQKATKWYEIAAASKYRDSLHKLAELYINTDVMKSIGYYKLAIEQKDEKAKIAYDKILQENKNFATINNQSEEINKLKEEIKTMKIQIEELELMPEGPKYKEAKDHFNLLAKSLE